MKRSPIRKSRSKPRPGRLKGAALTQLRRDVFERDGYTCQHVQGIEETMRGYDREVICGKVLTWQSAHMAHIRNKRMWGDSPENCTTKCAEHHLVNEHAYGPSGVKPCPAKQSVYETPDVGPEQWAESGVK